MWRKALNLEWKFELGKYTKNPERPSWSGKEAKNRDMGAEKLLELVCCCFFKCRRDRDLKTADHLFF